MQVTGGYEGDNSARVCCVARPHELINAPEDSGLKQDEGMFYLGQLSLTAPKIQKNQARQTRA